MTHPMIQVLGDSAKHSGAARDHTQARLLRDVLPLHARSRTSGAVNLSEPHFQIQRSDWARPCSDVQGWTNFFGHRCSDYLKHEWCRDGTITNASQRGGSLNGWPERACCACGRGNGAWNPKVQHLFFYSTHAIDETDLPLLRRYNTDATHNPILEFWLLIFASVEEPASASGDATLATHKRHQVHFTCSLTLCIQQVHLIIFP